MHAFHYFNDYIQDEHIIPKRCIFYIMYLFTRLQTQYMHCSIFSHALNILLYLQTKFWD